MRGSHLNPTKMEAILQHLLLSYGSEGWPNGLMHLGLGKHSHTELSPDASLQSGHTALHVPSCSQWDLTLHPPPDGGWSPLISTIGLKPCSASQSHLRAKIVMFQSSSSPQFCPSMFWGHSVQLPCLVTRCIPEFLASCSNSEQQIYTPRKKSSCNRWLIFLWLALPCGGRLWSLCFSSSWEHEYTQYNVHVTVGVRVTLWALAIPTNYTGASILSIPVKEIIVKTKKIYSMWLHRQKEQISRSGDSPAQGPSSRSYMKFRFEERARECITKQFWLRRGPAHPWLIIASAAVCPSKWSVQSPFGGSIFFSGWHQS